MDKAERLVKDLGEVDTSTCDVDALMVHPRVQAALREHVFTCISIFFSLSER
jgi:hypothetical protein